MVTILIAVATQGPRLSAELRGSESAFTVINSGVASAIGVISFACVQLGTIAAETHNATCAIITRVREVSEAPLTAAVLIFGSLNQPTLDRFNRVTHVSMSFAVLASTAMALFGYLVFTNKTPGNVLNAFPADMLVINIARGCFGLNMCDGTVSLPADSSGSPRCRSRRSCAARASSRSSSPIGPSTPGGMSSSPPRSSARRC